MAVSERQFQLLKRYCPRRQCAQSRSEPLVVREVGALALPGREPLGEFPVAAAKESADLRVQVEWARSNRVGAGWVGAAWFEPGPNKHSGESTPTHLEQNGTDASSEK